MSIDASNHHALREFIIRINFIHDINAGEEAIPHSRAHG